MARFPGAGAPLPQLTAVAEAPFSPVHITPDALADYLGKRRFQREEIADRTSMPGVAVGLSWTMTGGEILFFEATKMPGKKGFVLTGQIGRSHEGERAGCLELRPQ